jgi:hypothetical protein
MVACFIVRFYRHICHRLLVIPEIQDTDRRLSPLLTWFVLALSCDRPQSKGCALIRRPCCGDTDAPFVALRSPDLTLPTY